MKSVDKPLRHSRYDFLSFAYAPELVIQVITLLAYGCPIQAIVKAFGLDERTVCDWHRRAGQHCQQVHGQLVESSQQDLEQVQAMKSKSKHRKALLDGTGNAGSYVCGWAGWLAETRLDLIQALADEVRNIAYAAAFVGGGRVSQLRQRFWNAFRSKFRGVRQKRDAAR